MGRRLDRLGSHTRPRPPVRGRLVVWWTLAGLAAWLVSVLHQGACKQTKAGEPVNAMLRLCYSDIPIQYQRNLAQGQSPFAGETIDQAPLVGFLVEFTRLLTSLFHPVRGNVGGQAALNAANSFFTLTQLLLFVCLLVLLRAHLVASGRPAFDRAGREVARPWMTRGLVAILVTVVTAGLISWELLAAALLVSSIACWRRDQVVWSGVLAGLALAANGHALALVVGLGVAVVVQQRGRLLEWLTAVALPWLLLNLPVLARHPDGWADHLRGLLVPRTGIGSVWWVLDQAKIGATKPYLLTLPLTVVLWVAVCWLASRPGRTWRPEQTAVALMALSFALSPAFTPQQALLLVPLMALARPTREVLVLAAVEALYWVWVFTKLNGSLMMGPNGQDRSFWFVTMLRIAVELWVALGLVFDPRRGPVPVPESDARSGTWAAPELALAGPVPAARAVAGEDAESARGLDIFTEEPDEASDRPAADLDAEPDARFEAPTEPETTESTERSGASRVTRLPLWQQPEVQLYAWIWAASRLVLALTLVWVVAEKDRPLLKALSGWDVEHYVTVAVHGYADHQEVAFFPGLPMVLRLFNAIGVNPAVAGVAVALVCSALAGLAMWRLGGLWSAGLWLAAPATVFTFVAYSEAPFCAAAFWAWERAQQRKWAQAAVLAAIACTIRVSGLFLVGALVVMAIVGNGREHPAAERFTQRLRDAAWLVLPLLVLFGYAAHLHHITGSWTAWYDSQKANWGRTFHWPWESFTSTWAAAQPSYWPGREKVATMFLAEIVSMAVGVLTTIICLARRRWAEASWVAVQVVAFSTSNWWMSTNRAVLLWFPTWLILGSALAALTRPQGHSDRSGRLMVALMVTAGLAAVAVGWASWYFAGEWAS